LVNFIEKNIYIADLLTEEEKEKIIYLQFKKEEIKEN
jgi:hypothetical protein